MIDVNINSGKLAHYHRSLPAPLVAHVCRAREAVLVNYDLHVARD